MPQLETERIDEQRPTTDDDDGDDRFLNVLVKDWRACQNVEEHLLDVSKFRIYDITRAGRSIHWFCDAPVVAKRLSHLEGRGARLDSDLVEEILQNVSPKKPLAKSAFTVEQRFSKSDSPLFANGILQLAVYDRIKFSLIPPESAVPRCPTLPTSRPDQLGTNVRACLDLGDKWHSTLERFDNAFACAANAPSATTRLTPGQSPVSSLAVSAEDTYRSFSSATNASSLSSLATGASGSDMYLFYAAVKHNFCLASLGLVALCLPPKMNKKAKWDSVLVTMKNSFTTGKTPNAMTTLLDGLAEDDLLRAIYLVVAFSPFCLICDRRVALDPVLRKMHMHDVAEALCYRPRPYEDCRLRIEHALFRLIRKMATDGSHIFDNEMRSILARSRVPSLPVPILRRPLAESSQESFRKINEYVAGIVYNNHGFLAQYENAARVTPDDLRKDFLSFILYTLKGIKTNPLQQWSMADELPVLRADRESDSKGRGKARRRVGSGSSLNFDETALAAKPVRCFLAFPFLASLKWHLEAHKTGFHPVFDGAVACLAVDEQGRFVTRLKDIVSPITQHSLVRPEVHHPAQWESMSRGDRVKLVHEQRAVVGAWLTAVRSGPYRITCWDEDEMCKLVSQNDWVRVYDLSLDDGEQMYVAPVSAILCSLGDGNEIARSLSCTYIPADCSDAIIPQPLRDLDDGRTVDLLRGSTLHEWCTNVPAGVSSRSVWVHIASRSNTSELEVATSGLCIYLSPLVGSMRVYLPEKIEIGKTDTENAWKGLNARDVSCWKVYQLHRNQEIILKPDTPHFLLYDEDCLALAVNFYCCGTVGDSLKAILRQHYCGGTTTVGPLRDSAPVVFCKLLAVVIQELKRESGIKLPGKFRDWGDVADLALLVSHLDQLQPRLSMSDPRRATSELWQSTAAFKRDFLYSKKLVQSYLNLIVGLKCDEAIKAFRAKTVELKALVFEYSVEQKHRHDLHVKVVEYKL